jgi:Protein of unknown function (DUF3987)
VNRGHFFLSTLCLSLFGGTQPTKLLHYLRNPRTNLSDDGALYRFQLLVYPNPPARRRHVDQYRDTKQKDRVFAILKKLAYADFHDLGAKSDEFNKTPWFHFNIGVKALFENWLATNEDKVADKHEPIMIRQHLSKYPDLLCALG